MTYFVKCDTCGKIQEGVTTETDYVGNPINPETDEKWYSRIINGKVEHACKESCLKEGLVWPKWALP